MDCTIKITEEMLKSAETYLSLPQKEGLAHYLAVACVDEKNGLFVERYGVKQRILMGVLAKLYLGEDFEKQKITMESNGREVSGVLDCCMTVDEYDNWAGSHVYAQINRMVKRGGAEVSDKAYEMLNDHKTFGIMLDKEIGALIAGHNDILNRAARALAAQITPERVQSVLEEIKKAVETAELEQKKEDTGDA